METQNPEKKKIRVLLVDDNSRARKGLSAFLSTQPEIAVVGEAADGSAALNEAEKKHPDLILMDVEMPGMDGITATRLVKKLNPSPAVLILTMYSSYRQSARIAGADGFFLKGGATDALVEEIRAVFKAAHRFAPA